MAMPKPYNVRNTETTQGLRIMDKPEYIDTKTAAELTGFAQHTVAEMCKDGRIDCKKFGRTWAVNKDEILAVKRDNRGRPQGT